ncbi:hypothetical protein HOY82DRAFT_613927 [Tuber indicum]|nr:hypothetical protein HOY82DRAFT_613927 [Tuber indicum]
MSTTSDYVVTHTFTKMVIVGMILKVIGDVTIGYFGQSAVGSDRMTVNQYSQAAVTQQDNITSIIAAACIQQLVQQMQELMTTVTANVQTETATATITPPPHTGQPAPTNIEHPFDHYQLSWLREYLNQFEFGDKDKPTATDKPINVAAFPQWYQYDYGPFVSPILDGQMEDHDNPETARPHPSTN